MDGDTMHGDRVRDQACGESGQFLVGDHPADDQTTKDVEDQVQTIVGPLGGPSSLVMSQLQTSLGRRARSKGM
jgi:hypothetical protein